MELYSKYFYFLLLLFSFSFPFIRSFENKLNYYKKWPALLSGVVLMIGIHIPIDIYFTNIGVWSFNKEFVCGVYLANLPIEEWLFFLIIPFCCVFIYECTNYFLNPKKPSLTNYKVTFLCGIVFIILACLLNEKTYTSLYFSLSWCLFGINIFITAWLVAQISSNVCFCSNSFYCCKWFFNR